MFLSDVFSRRRARLMASVIGACMAAQTATAATTSKSYVVNWFYLADYYSGDAECPTGLNPNSIDFYRRDFERLGYSKEKIDELLHGYPQGGFGPWTPYVQVRGNGKDNVYENPLSAPDPGLKIIQGKYAFGFDLDGKGPNQPKSFENPETGEKGVDNQLFRTTGCIVSYVGGKTSDVRAAYPDYIWEVLRDRMPAWLITVVSDDGKDGPATLILERAVDTVVRDASGVNVRANMTYRRDVDPRSHNVFKGKIKGGILTTEPASMNMTGDVFGLNADMSFKSTRLRVQINPDGSLHGQLGGYQPWMNVYFGISSRAHLSEYLHSQDTVAVYYALRREADSAPDPKTKQNMDISSAYAFQAVPAFVVNDEPPARLQTSQAR